VCVVYVGVWAEVWVGEGKGCGVCGCGVCRALGKLCARACLLSGLSFSLSPVVALSIFSSQHPVPYILQTLLQLDSVRCHPE